MIIACFIIGFYTTLGMYERATQTDFNVTSLTKAHLSGNFFEPSIDIIDEIKPTKKIEFKLGDEITYEGDYFSVPAISDGRKYEVKDYMYETIARITGKFQGYEKHSFKIIYKIKEIETRGMATYKIESIKKFLEPPYYTISEIDTIAENGDIINTTQILPEDEITYKIRDLLNKGRIHNLTSNFIGGTLFFMFSHVTCALNESFSWMQIVRREMNLNTTLQIKNTENNKTSAENVTLKHCSDDEVITKYKVVGIENINGRKCFKVIATETIKKYGCENFTLARGIDLEQPLMMLVGENPENKKIVATFWIDAEKRILVKAEAITTYGRYEIRLIDS